jgi:polyisoprenyl-phosphate glycosyltransferase
MLRFAVLTPVLDDWESFSFLLKDISGSLADEDVRVDIIAVDDGSVEPIPAWGDSAIGPSSCIASVTIIRLALNLGHQRAIAVGLASLAKRDDLDAVIVMDSDGEDRPADLVNLITSSRMHPGHVIMAHRSQRSEGIVFKSGYMVYKAMFRAFTGKIISFGNFSLIPMQAVRRLIHVPDLWNNLPAAIIRSRLRFLAVDTIRGTRYAGQSRMNFASLIVHGLSAMSVYADIIFVRILMATSFFCGVLLLAMLAVLGIRLGTSLAIPGWATTVFGDLLIILAQALVMIVATTLMILSSRSARPLVPIADTAVFIAEVKSMSVPRIGLGAATAAA